MAQAKTALKERDANAAPKQPAKGKKPSTATDKSNTTPAQPSLEDVANKITKTHGRKRSHDEQEQQTQPSPSNNTTNNNNHPHATLQDLADVDYDGKIKFSCDQVRSRINALIRSGEIKVGEFQRELGVSSTAWGNFMKQSGSMAGQFTDTYTAAHEYFVKREKKGLKIPRATKKAKTTTASSSDTAGSNSKNNKKDPDEKYEVADVLLDAGSEGRVPIFDTCDDLRTKINAYLKQAGHSQAGLGRALTAVLESDKSSESGRKVTPAQVKAFLEKKGPRGGATSPVYYAGYIFFEKVRVKQAKPKSKKREEMEQKHGAKGCSTKAEPTSGLLLMPNEIAEEDKYGIVTFTKLPPGATATRPRRK